MTGGKKMDFKFERQSAEPVYRQLAAQIRLAIRAGELEPGSKLPTARMLHEKYGIAGGTVKEAYRLLQSEQIVFAVQGSGYYVTVAPVAHTLEEAAPRISAIFDDLMALPDLSPREIYSLCCARMRTQTVAPDPVRIAWIDCSPEVLHSTARQLETIPHVRVDAYTTEEFCRKDKVQAAIYDFVITTPNHVGEIAPLIAGTKCQLEKLDFTVSHETTVNMLHIPTGCTIAVLYKVRRFFHYVQLRLQEFERAHTFLPCHYEEAANVIRRFQSSNLALVIPGDYPSGMSADAVEAVETFIQKGGQTIFFYPTVDQGSLLFLNEKIHRFDLDRKAAKKEDA